MAFDRPLEADRVDDLSLISSFARAPVIGLMWFLGGKMSSKLEDGEREKQQLVRSTDAPESPDRLDSHHEEESGGNPQRASCAENESDQQQLSHVVARMTISKELSAGTDVSDDGECSSLEGDNEQTGSLETPACSTNDSRPGLTRMRRSTRKMSWSDESGQSLVQYIDESQGSFHSSSSSMSLSSGAAPKPMKSAMKRSSSVRGGSSKTAPAPVPTSQCIPSGLTSGGGDGLIMPTKPEATAMTTNTTNGTNGYVSPQWGWYISTTPPTPEMYYSSHKSSPRKNSQRQHEGMGTSLPLQQQPISESSPLSMSPVGGDGGRILQMPPETLAHPPSPPPVFHKGGVPKGMANPSMGWPTVPL